MSFHFEMCKALISVSSAFLMIGAPLAAQTEEQALRIISPANNALVRPGRKLPVKVTGNRSVSALAITGVPSDCGEANLWSAASVAPEKRVWTVMLDVPLNCDPEKYSIAAVGMTPEGAEVYSGLVTIDIEPVEIPQVSFGLQPVLMPFGGWCISLTSDSPCGPSLLIWGTYPDGTMVSLNRSTRITYESQDPSIARVNPDKSSLVGLSPGKTKIMVFGKYAIDVTVLSKAQTK